MKTVSITIEIKGGVATVTEVTGPARLAVTVTLHDYDTDGADPDQLDTDEDGVPCVVSEIEYHSPPRRPGFV